MYGDRPHVMKIESDVSRDGTTLNALGLECGVECAESEREQTQRFLGLWFTPISWAAASPSVRTFVRMVGIPTRTASSVLVDIVHPLFMMTAENTQIRYRIQLLLCHLRTIHDRRMDPVPVQFTLNQDSVGKYE